MYPLHQSPVVLIVMMDVNNHQKEVKQMNEVAGNIAVRCLMGDGAGHMEFHINKWLEENADVEVIEIRLMLSESLIYALIIYRKE